jgi:predicted nuclease with TOPRIM domain
METRLRRRLEELSAEYDKGKKTLEELEGQASNLRATLMRISGAIQVLQEELGEGGGTMAPQSPD